MNKDNKQSSTATLTDIHYHTKATLSQAFADIFEDLLKNAYDNDEPLATQPIKCTTGIQAGSLKTPKKKQADIKIVKYESLFRFCYLDSYIKISVSRGIVKITVIQFMSTVVIKENCLKHVSRFLKVY